MADLVQVLGSPVIVLGEHPPVQVTGYRRVPTATGSAPGIDEHAAVGSGGLEVQQHRLRFRFDPYLLIVPQDWAITVHSPHDLAGRPWVAGPPGTACDHALQRLAAQTGITVTADDVWTTAGQWAERTEAQC